MNLSMNFFSVVIGASEHVCQRVEDVMSLLKKGSTLRHTGATQMNDESSRSHAIFTLYIGEKKEYLIYDQQFKNSFFY